MQAAESNNDTYYFALSEGLDLRKSGYSFIGWAEDSQAIDPQYIAGSTISLSSDRPNKTLYAVWRIDKAWNNITKMQELTPNTCRGLALNTSKQLTDERDSKLYWVTRLADGNCWMTQNLDYDIPESKLPGVIRYDSITGLNPEDKEWPDATDDNTADEIARYYDPGNYYYTNMDSWKGCNNVTLGFADTECITTAGWKTTTANEEEKHFHVGNYYNWYAATNGSGTNDAPAETEANDSICPAGWRLPESGIDKSGSYGTAIPVNSTASTDILSLAGKYKMTNNTSGATIIRKAPLYFVPSGSVYTGKLYNAGSGGGMWASTSLANSSAYRFGFNSTQVLPAYISGSHAGAGVVIRCLLKGH